MNLRIHSVDGKGDVEKESVWLEVTGDTDVGRYMLCDTTYVEEGAGQVSNRLRHIYWFPAKPVKKGDYVRLFSKAGLPTTSGNKGGTNTYTIFWGLKETVWNKGGDCAILFRIAEWDHKKV